MKPSTVRVLIISYLLVMMVLGLASALLIAPKASFAANLFSLSRILALAACFFFFYRRAAISRVFVPIVMLAFVFQWAWLSLPMLLKRVQSVLNGTSDSAFLLGMITGQLIYILLLILVGWLIARSDVGGVQPRANNA